MAEIVAVSLRLAGRQFEREAFFVDRVLSFVADPFPWEEIEAFASALVAHPELRLRLTLAKKPQVEHHPYDFEVMRTQAVSRVRQEMSTIERIMLARNRTQPTLVDGPLLQLSDHQLSLELNQPDGDDSNHALDLCFRSAQNADAS